MFQDKAPFSSTGISNAVNPQKPFQNSRTPGKSSFGNYEGQNIKTIPGLANGQSIPQSNTANAFKKLFIHNIDFRVTNEELYQLFKEYGKVYSLEVPRDREGKHRGLGFVEYYQHDEAQRALDQANGRYLHQREIRLDVIFIQFNTSQIFREKHELDQKRKFTRSRSRSPQKYLQQAQGTGYIPPHRRYVNSNNGNSQYPSHLQDQRLNSHIQYQNYPTNRPSGISQYSQPIQGMHAHQVGAGQIEAGQIYDQTQQYIRYPKEFVDRIPENDLIRINQKKLLKKIKIQQIRGKVNQFLHYQFNRLQQSVRNQKQNKIDDNNEQYDTETDVEPSQQSTREGLDKHSNHQNQQEYLARYHQKSNHINGNRQSDDSFADPTENQLANNNEEKNGKKDINKDMQKDQSTDSPSNSKNQPLHDSLEKDMADPLSKRLQNDQGILNHSDDEKRHYQQQDQNQQYKHRDYYRDYDRSNRQYQNQDYDNRQARYYDGQNHRQRYDDNYHTRRLIIQNDDYQMRDSRYRQVNGQNQVKDFKNFSLDQDYQYSRDNYQHKDYDISPLRQNEQIENYRKVPISEKEIEDRIQQISREAGLDQFPDKDWSFYKKEHLRNRPKPNPNRISYGDLLQQQNRGFGYVPCHNRDSFSQLQQRRFQEDDYFENRNQAIPSNNYQSDRRQKNQNEGFYDGDEKESKAFGPRF
ncbi:sc35-like splicing factor [Stylonychia lemnae]|uniref:Sc35-like splicing factor n=1 Tax=Stylonychia lemnae TaxID=5949 RepID=A0A078AU62_STYLE|nr:sc35-like splicing factor [Stylonychia lemnae]|eukprot:CDW85945.1 sc35-like splicing factor [Stylonychia lemnae]